MNKKTQIIRMITAVALGLALAGSAVGVLAAGMGLDAGAMVVYGPALAASVLAIVALSASVSCQSGTNEKPTSGGICSP